MALQVALSIIETSVVPVPPLPKLPNVATYTVWLSGSAKIPIGPAPTGTIAGACVQPVWSIASHVAPLKTDTPPPLVTYTLSVCSSIAIVLRSGP